jgi:tetratricopeptide (TPR) repeat protein
LADLYLRTGHRDRAVDLMRSAAEILTHKEMLAEAAAVYRRLLVARQDDEDALLKAAEIARALDRSADADAYIGAAADWRAARGDAAGAAALRSRPVAVESAPPAPADGDARVRAHLARTYIAMGDAAHAAEYLTAEVAGDDARLLLTVAEIQLRGGEDEEAQATLERVAALRPSLAADIAKLALEAARHTAPEVAFRALDIAVTTWMAESRADLAAAALQKFHTVVPDSAEAQVRYVEVTLGAEASEPHASTVISFPAAASSGRRARRS